MANVTREDIETGYHFDTSKGEFLHLDKAAAYPEDRGRLVKVPATVVAVAAPAMSVAYVIFLPFTGIAGILAFLGLKAKGLVLAMKNVWRSSQS